MAVLIAAAVLGVAAPGAAAQDRWAVDDPCGDSGRLVSVMGDGLHVFAGDLFLRHDLRRAEVLAPAAGGIEARLSLCADVGDSDRRGGVRGVTALAAGCRLALEAHDAPTVADPTGTTPLEPRLSGSCGSQEISVALPAPALAVTGRDVLLRLRGDEPGLPEVVRQALQPGVAWQKLGAHGRPSAVDELAVFAGDDSRPQLVLSPGGNVDRAGGSGAIVLRG